MTGKTFQAVICALLWVIFTPHPGNATGQTKNLDGAWFACEFAHSQIAPDDNCKMLDDDGFLVAGQKVNHIKVLGSQEQACRQNRTGNCFKRDQAKVVVARDSTGTFRTTTDGFQIEYWGCSQEYKMSQRSGYYEVTPVDGLCYWASDKRYYLARYTGELKITVQDDEEFTLSTER